MRITHFVPDHPPQLLDSVQMIPDEGYIWIDFVREEAADWTGLPEQLLENLTIDIRHVEDSLNPTHVSFFDGTDDYDALVFEEPPPAIDGGRIALEMRSASIFVFPQLLVTVRAADAPSFDMVLARCNAHVTRAPRSTAELAYRFLDAMVDRLLAIREPLTRRVESLQDQMLHPPDDGRMDWRELMRFRRTLRRLARSVEDQWEAVQNWRRDSLFEWDDRMRVRLADLGEHITRMRDLAAYLERDLDMALQFSFAVLSQRQNEIMKVFTVVAVVFMPMSLLTGIWGMNFQYMPELHWRYSYFGALLIVFGCGVGMYWWFKRRNFF